MKIDKTQPMKSTNVNEVFSRYMEELESIQPKHTEVIKNFPVYVGYIGIARMLAFYEIYKKTQTLAGNIAEIGSYQGASLVLWGKLIKLFEPHSMTQAHGFDWFQGMAPGKEDNDDEQGKWVGDYEMLCKLIELQELEDCIHVHKMDVTTELDSYFEKFPYMRYKIVFVDCGISEVMVATLEKFWPRLVPGGILVMDHYNNFASPSESEIVDRYVQGCEIQQFSFVRGPTAYIVKE